MTTTVTVKGSDTLHTSLTGLAHDLAHLDLSAAAPKVLEAVERVVPVDTGAFRASHKVIMTNDRIAVHSEDPARLLNYGIPHHHIKGRGFYKKVNAVLETIGFGAVEDAVGEAIKERKLT